MNQTYQNSVKVPKVVQPTNKKTLLKDFGDLRIKQHNVPMCSICHTFKTFRGIYGTPLNKDVPNYAEGGRCVVIQLFNIPHAHTQQHRPHYKG